jgi:hypothetical protein
MTDPERISRRGVGLAAELLRASGDEQPDDAGLQRTLAALGVAGALLTATSAAGAATAAGGAMAAGGAGATAAGSLSAGASAGKAVTAALLAKWVGVGVVGGVGLASAAAFVTAPIVAPSPPVAVSARPVVVPAVESAKSPALSGPAPSLPPEPTVASPTPAPRVSAPAPATEPALDVGAPLAAEVAFVDRARALLSSGRSEQGLAELARYEREFPEARLLPEVLFLQLEACERLGRAGEARHAAQRLVDGFPRSPHVARARERLAHFP